MVWADSHRITRVRSYSGPRQPHTPRFAYGTHTHYGHPLKSIRLTQHTMDAQLVDQARRIPQPHHSNPYQVSHHNGLASFAFARHYSRNHMRFLFLPVLRCFTSRRSLHTCYTFTGGQHHTTGARFPHSDTLRSQVGCHLPEDYRRLPRPSSAPDAKASTECP